MKKKIGRKIFGIGAATLFVFMVFTPLTQAASGGTVVWKYSPSGQYKCKIITYKNQSWDMEVYRVLDPDALGQERLSQKPVRIFNISA